MKKVRMINDPINMVILAAEQVFPSVEAVVQYDPALEDEGSTWAIGMTEDDGTMIILNPNVAVAEAASALAQALTSCHVGTHVPTEDDEFQAALAEIVAAYENINNSDSRMN